jgi:2-methylcitrate dehydratase PrpD
MKGYKMTEHGTIAERLAARIAAFGPEHVKPKARERALIGILDTVAVTMAGAHAPCVQKLRAVPGICDAPGPCTLIGQAGKVSMLDAALINGVASHALDYDDFSSVFGGHQSAPLVPALFALAEAEELSGKAVLAAYAIGVETEIRLARAVHFHHYDKGWHPTATLGTIGAAAATAHLLRLPQDLIVVALALAVSQAAGVKANFGTMTKPFHVGMCSRAGLLASLMAQQGYTANPAAFEHPQGFFEVFNGAGTYNADRLFEYWADPLELEDDGIAVKSWPCCGSTHAAIRAALDLRAKSRPRPEDIVKIEVLPHGRRLAHTNTPHPETELQAKFSVQYVVVRALLDGAVKLSHFDDAAIADTRVADLLSRVEARAHPDMADNAASQWSAEVIVHTADGQRLSQRVDNLMAGGGAVPKSASGMWDKFMDCAEVAQFPADIGGAVFERLETLDSAPDMTSVLRMMVGPAERRVPEKRCAGTHVSGDALPETNWVP